MQEEELRRGQWLEEEDERLSMMVAVFGERRWDALAKTSGMIQFFTLYVFFLHVFILTMKHPLTKHQITLFKYATIQG